MHSIFYIRCFYFCEMCYRCTESKLLLSSHKINVVFFAYHCIVYPRFENSIGVLFLKQRQIYCFHLQNMYLICIIIIINFLLNLIYDTSIIYFNIIYRKLFNAYLIVNICNHLKLFGINIFLMDICVSKLIILSDLNK